MNDTPIRCLLVDDEPPARDVLKRYIDAVPMLKLAGECSNALQAMAFLQQQPVDLLLLDIRMPQLNGNELLKVLSQPPKVIFTTAHPEYALEGFDLDVVDYLLKPIHFERFLKAVNKVSRVASATEAQTASNSTPATSPFVYFRADRRMVKVLLQDIIFIESMKDYIKVHTTGGIVITKQSITSVEVMLPEQQFLRVHRSFIVSLHWVRSFNHESVFVEQHEIPIGKLFRQSALKAMGK